MHQLQLSDGTSIHLGSQIGSGGEGAVYNVIDNDEVVAKIYHPHRLNQALINKVNAMVLNPPVDDTKTLNHISIAWPTSTIINGHHDTVGYLMPKLTASGSLYDLIQPQQRQKRHSKLNHRHLYRTARNIALAMKAIHDKNYVIGDINFNNILFSDVALVTMIDCDSMQVIEHDGTVHYCVVGVPDYTPPELQGADFRSQIRTANHDAFGLAVLIFQLLMQGFHPYTGRAKPGTPDVEQSHIYCIKNQIFPYIDNQLYEPPKVAPHFDALPASIRQLFIRAFTQIDNRPTPKEWIKVIGSVEERLVKCTNDSHHYHPSDGACVICEVEYNSGRRQRPTQIPLDTSTQQRSARLSPLKRRKQMGKKTTPNGSQTINTSPTSNNTPSSNTGVLRPLPLPQNTGPLPTSSSTRNWSIRIKEAVDWTIGFLQWTVKELYLTPKYLPIWIAIYAIFYLFFWWLTP